MTRGLRLMPRPAARTCSRRSTRSLERLRARDRRADRPPVHRRCSPRSSCSSCSRNWSGLVPRVGRVEWLRAPDERRQHHPRPRARRASCTSRPRASASSASAATLGKFFPFYEFKNGIGAGLIALFVGLVELMLEFVKPVTLSMRLFGNIYGGEVALGVITGADHRDHPGRPARPRVHAQRRSRR